MPILPPVSSSADISRNMRSQKVAKGTFADLENQERRGDEEESAGNARGLKRWFADSYFFVGRSSTSGSFIN